MDQLVPELYSLMITEKKLKYSVKTVFGNYSGTCNMFTNGRKMQTKYIWILSLSYMYRSGCSGKMKMPFSVKTTDLNTLLPYVA